MVFSSILKEISSQDSSIIREFSSQDVRSFIFFSIFQGLYYGAGRAWLAEKARLSGAAPGAGAEVRARAWLLSALVASLLSICGVWKGVEAMGAFVGYFGVGGIAGFAAWAMSDGPVENGLIVYFLAFLVLDVVIGLADYRETLRWDTTWLHHVTYFFYTICLIRWHATNCFMAYMICEVPTLVLALGNIEPALRNDLLFGATFAATRLGYFGGMSLIFWSAYPVSLPDKEARARSASKTSAWYERWGASRRFAPR